MVGRRIDIVDVVAQHAVERAASALPPRAASHQRDDLNALLRVRGLLAMDGDAAFGAVVTSGMSITRSATETAPNFVRRLVLGALDAAIEVHSQ
jgi:hypothetical protein